LSSSILAVSRTPYGRTYACPTYVPPQEAPKTKSPI